MTTEALTNLVVDFDKALELLAERTKQMGPEVFALHVSLLHQDNVRFRADHEEIVIAFIREGMNELEVLNDREIINLFCRFFLAKTALSEILQRRLDERALHEKIIEAAKQRSMPFDGPVVQSALRNLSEEYSTPLFADFDQSSLDGDPETALRSLLIDAWNKCGEADFVKLCSGSIQTLQSLFGFKYHPPQLGRDSNRGRD